MRATRVDSTRGVGVRSHSDDAEVPSIPSSSAPQTEDATTGSMPAPQKQPGRTKPTILARFRRLLALHGNAFLWMGVVVAVSVLAAVQTMTSNDATALFEAGDSAGDALQVRRGLSSGWFATGHHTDTGVAHPGPFVLWLKAVAELLAPHLGVTTLWLSVVIFSAVKATAVTAAGAAVARTLDRNASGFTFVVVVFSGGWLGMTDPVGVGMQTIGIWLVIAAAASATAALRGSTGFLPVGMIAVGAAMHAHTTIFPGAALVFAILTWSMIKRWRSRRPTWWLALGAWSLFTIPLLVRMIIEPGWPLNYREAVKSRVESTTDAEVTRAPFELLGQRMDLPPDRAFIALVAMVAVAAIVTVAFKRWRTAMIPLLIFGIWSVVVALVSPQNQRDATELWWITGWWAFCVGLVGAALVALIIHFLPGFVSALAAGLAGGMMLAAAVPVFAAPISGTVGVDGSYVSTLADTVVERAGGRPVAVVIDRGWLSVEMGLVLELDRRGTNFCVLAPEGRIPDQELNQFIPTEMHCPTVPSGEFLVASSLNEQSAIGDIWYRQEMDPTTIAIHPSFVAGAPLCDPRERADYPLCDQGGQPADTITPRAVSADGPGSAVGSSASPAGGARNGR